ncbi:MAG: NfeD family protein [Cyanobacteria bacterium P01_F01_bin.150]
MLLISALIPPTHKSNPRTPAQPSRTSRPLARVEKAILPGEDGQVYFEGTYWRARFYNPNCHKTAAVGDMVEVVVGDRLPLLVMTL